MEDETLGLDEAFAEALTRGLARFVKVLGASKRDATAIREPRLAPVRLLFPGKRRKLSRKGRVSQSRLGLTPGFFVQFDGTPESAYQMARFLLVKPVASEQHQNRGRD